MLKRVIYVWEFPVRFFHWFNVLCILILSFTGYYIGNPFIHAYSASKYIMGWNRFIHFVLAYIFTIALVVRLYWSFVGNEYAKWTTFLSPFSKEGCQKLWHALAYFLFIKKKPPHYIGHSACASFAYLILFFLLFAEFLTGFALYSMSHHSSIIKFLFGWLLSILSPSMVRLYHHLIMWFLLSFAMVHVYIGWVLSAEEKNGLMESIFTGYKFNEGNKG